MIVATFDKTNNQQIDSAVRAFGHNLQKIDSWKDITTDKIVFCIDQHSEEEIKNYAYQVEDLKAFPHPDNATYVFGRNTNHHLTHEIIEASDAGKDVQILTIPGKTLWAEVAMGIILYDYELQHI